MKFLKGWICLFIFSIIFSCNNRHKAEKPGKITGSKNDASPLEQNAYMLYDQNKYAEAIKCFDSLIKKDSTNGDFYYKRAFSYTMLIQKSKAIEDFKKAINLKCKISHSYYNIGLEYSFDNDSLALYNFEQSFIADPGDARTYVEILDCKKRLKEWKLHPRSKLPNLQ